jgi:hypothetical protein
MARGVGARREGDRYQDIYGWYRALELLKPARKVWRVSIEDPKGESFDDVTIRPAPATSHVPEFAQVKFHVDLAGAYSSKTLMTKKSRNGTSLLQKAWESWRILKDEDARVQLLLVSTWSWDHKDPLASHLRRGPHLTASFVTGRDLEPAAQRERDDWKSHLGDPSEADFQPFLRNLQFRMGYPATAELVELTAERMQLVGLKSDQPSVMKGAEQVWRWIADEKDTITRDDMLEAVKANDLFDAPAEPAISLYIHTILKEPSETDSDYEIDWRDHFEGDEWLRGHKVHDATVWDSVMMPELVTVRAAMSSDNTVRLLRVKGQARLSAWFAIGAVFSRVAGWTLEVDQRGARWRNDVPPANDIHLVATHEDLSGDPNTLAVGVSVTGDLSADVRTYLAESGNPAGHLLLLSLDRPRDFTALRDAADATALSELVRASIRSALGHRAKRVLLFYFGPLSGAAFIGAQLNAIAGEVQVFEDQAPGYAPSFLIK